MHDRLHPRPGRDAAVDCIKTFAIVGVVLIHVSAGALNGAVGSAGWLGALVWGTVSRASVPLFFMCTGALLLAPERPHPARRILTHNLPRLLAALFFWAAAYALFHLAARGTLTPAALAQAGKELLLFRHEQHLYYLHIALLVYVCIPPLRVFTRHATREQTVYALAVWALCAVVYPTARQFWPLRLLGGIPQQWALNMAWGALGYCLLGHYLRTWPCASRALCPALWCAGACMVFGATWALSARAAAHVSRASFCVYLCHMFFLYVLRHFGLTASGAAAALTIPAIAAVTLAASMLLHAALRRIPIVNRWLI